MVGGTAVELTVDTTNGDIYIIRMVNVADAGNPLNPNIVKTQISGGAIMQLGFTLYEDMIFDGGQVTNASFADYKIPGFRDIPKMESDFVTASQENGPFGAKGVGESATFGVSPAIANAIHDAVGIRLTELPIKKETLFRALCAAQGRPLPEDE
jgi:CO/xanthine dehydrogenase Mo-binding subunit